MVAKLIRRETWPDEVMVEQLKASRSNTELCILEAGETIILQSPQDAT